MKNLMYKCKTIIKFIFIVIAFFILNLYVIDHWTTAYTAKVVDVDLDYVKVKYKKHKNTYTKIELRYVPVVSYFDGRNEYVDNLARPYYETEEEASKLIGSDIRIKQVGKELREAPLIDSIIVTILLVVIWLILIMLLILKIIGKFKNGKNSNILITKSYVNSERVNLSEDEFNELLQDFFK